MNKISRLAINEEGFIFDPTTGNSFTTNSVGLWILNKLKEGKGKEELLFLLCQEFQVDKEVAEKDLSDFLEQLRTYNLV